MTGLTAGQWHLECVLLPGFFVAIFEGRDRAAARLHPFVFEVTGCHKRTY
jgi:hypothetical protein